MDTVRGYLLNNFGVGCGWFADRTNKFEFSGIALFYEPVFRREKIDVSACGYLDSVNCFSYSQPLIRVFP